MKVFKEGDRSKAVCERCKEVVETVLVYRDFPFKNPAGIAKHILVGVCVVCGEIVSVPAQSARQVEEAREKVRKQS